MNTRNRKRTPRRTAREQAALEIADSRTLLDTLDKELQDFDGYSGQRPKDWGYAGTAAMVRSRLEELLVALTDIDEDTEEANLEAARRKAGIDVNRSWE